jgi:hypothetical protein
MYFGLIIVRAIVFLSKYIYIQMSSGQTSYGQMSLGKCLWPAKCRLGKCHGTVNTFQQKWAKH